MGSQVTGGLLAFLEDIVHPTDKRRGIELSAEDVIGTIREDRHAPVADKGNSLLRLCGFDRGTEIFSAGNAGFALNIDEHEIVVPGPEHLQSLSSS